LLSSPDLLLKGFLIASEDLDVAVLLASGLPEGNDAAHFSIKVCAINIYSYIVSYPPAAADADALSHSVLTSPSL